MKNLIITGLPRSGTSFLCTKLNSIDNVVIINEPTEVGQAFRAADDFALRNVYDNFRTAITDGRAIPNKIKNGKFIEDTQETDSRQLYTAKVTDEKFSLGIKNTLVFLSNLHRIKRSMPEFHIIACVRHPYDTIGSWKNVPFAHLNTGQPKFLLQMVDEKIKVILEKIIHEPSVEKRQAYLWRFLAKQILKHANSLHIIKCEDLVKNPKNILDPLCNDINIGLVPPEEITETKVRKRAKHLSTKSVHAIKVICTETALNFGYKL